MDKNLTDSEIVKALECCVNWKKEGDCAKCPAYERPSFCIKEVRTRSLDLINRLQAENESKQATIDSFTDIGKLYSEIKAEAYKEFAERLKEKAQKTEIVCSGALITTNYSISAKKFNNLLKELVGDSDV